MNRNSCFLESMESHTPGDQVERDTSLSVKLGDGSIMVWGVFSGKGVGPLHKIDGIMDKDVYLSILDNIMLP